MRYSLTDEQTDGRTESGILITNLTLSARQFANQSLQLPHPSIGTHNEN